MSDVDEPLVESSGQAAQQATESSAVDAAASLEALTLLPEITRDESGEGWGDERTEQDYLRERPPHHGD
ncbi:MAG: hypothetical protein WCP26_04565 [Actinomycetes bacterium]